MGGIYDDIITEREITQAEVITVAAVLVGVFVILTIFFPGKEVVDYSLKKHPPEEIGWM